MKLIVSDASPLIVIAKSSLIPVLTGMILEQWRRSGSFLSAGVVTAVLERAGET